MRVIIAGSRDINNRKFLEQVIGWAGEVGIEVTEVVSGMARGVDRTGFEWASDNGIPVHAYPANWEKYPYDAGLIRNCQMRAFGEGLIAVWDGRSTGTKHMIEQMITYGKPYFYYDLMHGDYFYGNIAGRESQGRSKESPTVSQAT